MAEIGIRPITPGDADAVAALWVASTNEVAELEGVYTPGISPGALAERLRGHVAAGEWFGWLAESMGRLAGYVTCEVQDGPPVFQPRRYVVVHDLDVAPAFRRQGVSRLLMAAVERHARSAGIHRLELGVVARDPRARAVWERHGFQPHFLVMHKHLEGSSTGRFENGSEMLNMAGRSLEKVEKPGSRTR